MSCAECARIRAALVLHDGEIEAALQSGAKPEDKLLERHGFTWEFLERTADKTEWPLASKLADALLAMGGLCENIGEKARLFDLMDRKIRSAFAEQPTETKEENHG
jgi:hypothetical protein